MVAPVPVGGPISPLPPLAPQRGVLHWNLAALAVALAAVGGSLWLSLGMELIPCPLCYYQRSFVMAAAAVLLLSLLTSSRATSEPSLLAFPLAVAGCGVAGFHVYLESSGKLECPHGILGIGTAPQQSLAVQVLLLVILVLALLRRPSMVVGVVVGIALAVGCIMSTPPLPKPQPHDVPPKVCQPPYPG